MNFSSRAALALVTSASQVSDARRRLPTPMRVCPREDQPAVRCLRRRERARFSTLPGSPLVPPTERIRTSIRGPHRPPGRDDRVGSRVRDGRRRAGSSRRDHHPGPSSFSFACSCWRWIPSWRAAPALLPPDLSRARAMMRRRSSSRVVRRTDCRERRSRFALEELAREPRAVAVDGAGHELLARLR